jgi:hypothetical protein
MNHCPERPRRCAAGARWTSSCRWARSLPLSLSLTRSPSLSLPLSLSLSLTRSLSLSLSQVGTVALDKTGTLTTGIMSCVAMDAVAVPPQVRPSPSLGHAPPRDASDANRTIRDSGFGWEMSARGTCPEPLARRGSVGAAPRSRAVFCRAVRTLNCLRFPPNATHGYLRAPITNRRPEGRRHTRGKPGGCVCVCVTSRSRPADALAEALHRRAKPLHLLVVTRRRRTPDVHDPTGPGEGGGRDVRVRRVGRADPGHGAGAVGWK